VLFQYVIGDSDLKVRPARKIAAALVVRDILCRRIESTYLADLLRFENNPYPRRRNARLMDFYHRTNYGQNEPENKAILIFN
jgi:hypothetical protein